MVYKKLSIVFLMLFIFLAFNVSSLEVKKTDISIQAGQYNNLTLTFTDVDSVELKTISDFANEDGLFTYVYNSLIEEFKIILEVRTLEGEEIGSELYGPFPVKVPISINYGETPVDNDEDVSVDDINPEENIEEGVANTVVETGDNTLTGLVIGNASGDGNKSDGLIFFIVGGLLIVSVVFFFILKARSNISKPPHILKKIEDNSDKEIKMAVSENIEESDLVVAQRKISELEKELINLKNKSKIEAIERHIMEENEALERLKEGRD